MNKWIHGTLDGQPFMVRIDSIQLIAPNLRTEISGKTRIWVDFEVHPGEFYISCDADYDEVIRIITQATLDSVYR